MRADPNAHPTLEQQIAELWERRSELSPADGDALAVVQEAVGLLDSGEARAAEVDADTGEVTVNVWLKQAILLLFRLLDMQTIELGPFEFADRIPLKRGYAASGAGSCPGRPPAGGRSSSAAW